MKKVLIVCLGNICRSPMAQVVLQHAVSRDGRVPALHVDSAGTGAQHRGEPADPRAVEALRKRGYTPGKLRSRRIQDADFLEYDLILAMDAANMAELRRRSPPQAAHKLRLFLDVLPGRQGQDVPDPYYGNAEGFERTLTLCEAGVEAWMAAFRSERQG